MHILDKPGKINSIEEISSAEMASPKEGERLVKTSLLPDINTGALPYLIENAICSRG